MLEVSLQLLPAKLGWATTIDGRLSGRVGIMVVDQQNSAEKQNEYDEDKAGRIRLQQMRTGISLRTLRGHSTT